MSGASVIGLDLAKHAFQVHRADEAEWAVLRHVPLHAACGLEPEATCKLQEAKARITFR